MDMLLRLIQEAETTMVVATAQLIRTRPEFLALGAKRWEKVSNPQLE
jgi:hypothetical protein